MIWPSKVGSVIQTLNSISQKVSHPGTHLFNVSVEGALLAKNVGTMWADDALYVVVSSHV